MKEKNILVEDLNELLRIFRAELNRGEHLYINQDLIITQEEVETLLVKIQKLG